MQTSNYILSGLAFTLQGAVITDNMFLSMSTLSIIVSMTRNEDSSNSIILCPIQVVTLDIKAKKL